MLKTASVRFKELSRWDVKSQILKQIRSTFPLYRIADLLQPIKNSIVIQDDVLYTQVTVRLHNKGIIARGQQMGADILTKSQNQVRQGQFIISKIDGKDGAFGIIPVNLHDAIVTNDFPVFDIKDRSLLLMEYFELFLSYEEARNMLQRTSVGTTGRKRLQIGMFLNLKIPLPPLAEQKRIITLWQGAQAQAQADRQKAEQLKQAIDAYLMKELGITIQKQAKAKVFTARFKDLVRWDIGFNLYPQYHSSTPIQSIKSILTFEKRDWRNNYDSTFPYIQISDINKDSGIFNHSIISVKDAPSRAKTLVRTGDLLISLTRPNLGAFAVIESSHNNFVVTSGFAVCNGGNIIENYFIMFLLQSSFGINLFNKSMTGALYPAISQEDLGNIKIPLPPLKKQQEIVDRITQIRAQIAQLQQGAQQTLDSAKAQIKKIILV